MEEADLSTAMLGRVRNHMLVALVGLAAGIGLIAAGPVLGGLAFGAVIPAWWKTLSVIAALVMIPAIGISSAFRLLRCPGCNGLVVFQVNAQASPFARRYSRQCRHCGKTIFDGRLTRRVRVVQVAVFVGTILLFGGLAVFGGH